jgi:DNA polymerase III delta prime subunit
MKSILCNNLEISYETQDAKKGSDTHDYIFGLLFHEINNYHTKRNILSNFSNLKKKRKIADYDNKIVDMTDSLIAVEEAKQIISDLKRVFGPLNI